MVDADQVSQQVPAVKVKWPLRIGLLVVLFLAWAMGLGFVEEIKSPLRKGFLLEAREENAQNYNDAIDILLGGTTEKTKERQRIAKIEAEEKAARYYTVAVGVIHSMFDLIAGGLAVLVWFLTRKRILYQ
jgi:hypothetical protein